MLTEQRRTQLDEIVQRMVQAKESDSNIKFVVEDFKQKYTHEQTTQPQEQKKNTKEKILSGVASLLGGKELAAGAGQAIKSLTNDPRDVATQSTQSIDQLIAEAKKFPVGSSRRKQLLEQANEISNTAAGQANENLADIPTNRQVAGSAGKLAITAATLGTPGVASGLPGRIAEIGLTGAAFQILDNLEDKEPVRKNVISSGVIAGALPVVGKVLSRGKELLQKSGQKIQFSLIKPSQADVSDGFKVETLKKYNLGGSLSTTLRKTEDKLNGLTEKLKTKISESDAVVDLNQLARETAQRLLSNKSRMFGDVSGVKRVLENLAGEIEEQSANGLVSLAEAQVIKQAAGKKGAWVFGFNDPEAKAIEKVYNEFYRALKKKIEDGAPTGVREINKQISELIPVIHAVIRRIPISQRNNVISLTDLISGGFAIGNPAAFSLFVANRLAKSGSFGKYLADLELQTPTTNVGKRIFGLNK